MKGLHLPREILLNPEIEQQLRKANCLEKVQKEYAFINFDLLIYTTDMIKKLAKKLKNFVHPSEPMAAHVDQTEPMVTEVQQRKSRAPALEWRGLILISKRGAMTQ